MFTRTPANVGSGRQLYTLTTPLKVEALPEPVKYLVLSLGRHGDTCLFPSDSEGRIMDLLGVGFNMGPNRWLTESEFDGYVTQCINQEKLGAKFTYDGDM